jgi:response regulator RpfG family c-di-GMP phosphodiesterase
MADKPGYIIMIVDDEEPNLKTLKGLLQRAGYETLTAASGAEGLEILESSKEPISLIISDQRMPEMTGAAFLEQAKKKAPDAIRFLLSDDSDMDALIEAVNKGEIHRYLSKPWEEEGFLAQVKQGLSLYELAAENKHLVDVIRKKNEKLQSLNKKLEQEVVNRTRMLLKQNVELEKSFIKTFRLGSSLVEMINPTLGEYLRQVGQLSKEVAEALGLEKNLINQIEIAGMFHDVGVIGIPYDMLKKHKSEMDPVERDLYTQHPLVASLAFEEIPQLPEVGTIIINHHENYDGTGYPHGFAGDEIHIGARILAAVSDYCIILNTWPTEIAAIHEMAHTRYGDEINDLLGEEDPETLLQKIAQRTISMGAGTKYDMAVVEKLEDVLQMRAQIQESQAWIDVDLLREDMILQKSVCLKDGRVIMSKGVRLKAELVESLKKLKAHGKIESQLYVSVPSQ